MSTIPKDTTATVIPCLRYRDAPAAIEWLCRVFGFYVIVSDADLVYRQAKEAGAEILLDIKDEDYGGRGFTCRDLEGHIWNFGTYDPWDQ